MSKLYKRPIPDRPHGQTMQKLTKKDIWLCYGFKWDGGGNEVKKH